MPLTIRPANALDIDMLVPLVEKYRAFYKQEPSPRTRTYLIERIESGEALVFLANLDSHMIGFTLIYPTFSTVSLSPIWLLNDLFVEFNYRGQGIASALMARAEAEAQQAGATRVWLRTAHDNTTAQALYEGRGYVQDEVFRRYDLLF